MFKLKDVILEGLLNESNVCLLVTAEDIEESRVAKREMYSALKARKEVLEAALRKKMEELKLVCIAEAVWLFI